MLTVLCAGGCTVKTPWRDEPIGQELNIAFELRNNLIYLPSTAVDGRSGNFLVGTAQPTSVIDPKFSSATSPHLLQINNRKSLTFAAVSEDLHGVGDVILGADLWANNAVTIDYHAGLITMQTEGIHPELMTLFNYAGQPAITVTVDGRTMRAVLDTTSPDTLVLPGKGTRRQARVVVAGFDFGPVDVRYAPVESARIGNRLLSKFLITVDYGRHVIGLWRDPRIAL